MKLIFLGLTVASAAVLVACVMSRVAFADSQSDKVLDEADQPSIYDFDPPSPPTPPKQPKIQLPKNCFAEDLSGACPGDCIEYERKPGGGLIPSACAAREFCDNGVTPCDALP